MELDREKQQDLGLPRPGRTVRSDAAMRYAAGAVLRERERLARIFDAHGHSELASAIRDKSSDDAVFKWAGPETGLDEPPTRSETDG